MRYKLSPWVLALLMGMMTSAARADEVLDAAAGATTPPPAEEAAGRPPGRYRPDLSRGPALTAGSLESFRKRLRERLASTPPPAPGLRPMRGPADPSRMQERRPMPGRPEGDPAAMDPATGAFAAADVNGAASDRAAMDWSSDPGAAERGFAPPAGGLDRNGRPFEKVDPTVGRAEFAGRGDVIARGPDDLPPPPARMPMRPGTERPMPPTFADGALGGSVVGSPPTGRPGYDRPTDGPPPMRDIAGTPRLLPPGDVNILPYPPPVDPANGRGIVPPLPPERREPPVFAELPGSDPLGVPAPDPSVDPATGGVTTVTPSFTSDLASDAAPVASFAAPDAGIRRRVPDDVRARHTGSR